MLLLVFAFFFGLIAKNDYTTGELNPMVVKINSEVGNSPKH